MAEPKKDKSLPKVSSDDSSKPKSLNVWQRINAVRAEVESVTKDKTVGGGEFAYKVATHEVIKEMLRPLMAAHGLVDYVLELEYDRVDTGVHRGKNENKRPLISHQARYSYIVVNCDDPEDTHSFPVRGDGEDAGDKGPGKATTYALKAGQKILFMVSSDEDEEAITTDGEIYDQPESMLTPQQVDEIDALAKKLFGDTHKQRIESMCHKCFGLDELRFIEAKHYSDIVNLLQNQKKRELDAEITQAGLDGKIDREREIINDDELIPETNMDSETRQPIEPEPL